MSGRVIVVSVDGEDWQGDVQIWVLVVDTLGVAVAKVHFWVRKIFYLKCAHEKDVGSPNIKVPALVGLPKRVV